MFLIEISLLSLPCGSKLNSNLILKPQRYDKIIMQQNYKEEFMTEHERQKNKDRHEEICLVGVAIAVAVVAMAIAKIILIIK